MTDKPSYLVDLQRILAELDHDIRANPDPRLAIRESLTAAIAHIKHLPVSGGSLPASSLRTTIGPLGLRSTSPLISPEVSGKPQSRTYRFRDVMVSYLHEHGSTHKAKLAKVGVERNVFASEADALRAQTRLFRVWRDVFISEGKGFFNVRPNAPVDTMPRWSSKRQAVRR